MNPYMTQTPNANDVALVESIVSQRLKGSILWMVVGLLTTLGIGVATLMNPSWARFAASNFNILLIAEVAVVFLFSMRTYKANVMSLYAMFFIYSALNGVTLSLVSLAYGIMEATVPALIGALAFFVAFSIVGLTTKKNLAGLTPYLVAAIFGMIIVSLVFMAASYFSIPYLSSISYSTISLILGYLGVVVFLFSMRTYKANVMSLYAMFFIYSALNGVTLSLVSLAYGIMEATVPALIGALAFFVAFSIVGLTTKKNLAGLTPYLVAAIFGMIIVSLVFMAASYFSIPYLSSISYSTISLILGYVGVVVFSIFTAVDMNMIKNSVTQLALSEDETILDRIEIAGALSLYLDFINLFLSLLRIFGNRR